MMFIMSKISLHRFTRFYSSHLKMTSIIEKNPILYGDEASPPVRFVLMTASVLNIKMDFCEINLFRGNSFHWIRLLCIVLTIWFFVICFQVINPLQKVPALLIQNQVICDSHAICMYFCQQNYDHTLYSNEAITKARIDEMLFFNSGTLFPIDSALFTDYFSGKWPADQTKLDTLNLALDHLEAHLTKTSWLTGNEMRLCDICLMATVTSVYQIVQKTGKHKNIDRWLKKFETMPFYDINRRGLDRLLKFVKKL